MLTNAERLRRSSLFKRIYAAKKSVSSEFFTLYVLERQPRSAPRFPLVGFVIGKKVESKATERNRAKRRLREAYRLLRRSLSLQTVDKRFSETLTKRDLDQWYALVWVVRNEALSVEFDEICRGVSECILKAAEKYGKRAAQRKNG